MDTRRKLGDQVMTIIISSQYKPVLRNKESFHFVPYYDRQPYLIGSIKGQFELLASLARPHIV